MVRHLKFGLGVIVALLAFAPPAFAARLALVIGNDDYASVPRLERAAADTQAMRGALEKLGFEVALANNLDFKGMTRTIAEFEAKISPGDDVVFDFSGHGVAIDGRNYLLPVDVEQPQTGGEAEIKSFGRDAGQLVDDLRAKGPKLVFAILDACRNNPFQTASRSIGASRGLARMDPDPGAFILFSAGPGEEALDRLNAGDTAATSVFTRVLLKYIDTPGITLQKLAKLTQGEVSQLASGVGHVQFPDYFDRTADEPTLSASTCSTNPFVGTWQGVDPESQIKRTVTIRQSCQVGRPLLTFEEQWDCTQGTCHLGTRPAHYAEKSCELIVENVQKNDVSTFRLQLAGQDAMKVNIAVVFTDDSGREPLKRTRDYTRIAEAAPPSAAQMATAAPSPATPEKPATSDAAAAAPPAPNPAPPAPSVRPVPATGPFAACDTQHLDGSWQSTQPHPRSILRLFITSLCEAGRPTYRVEAWGACRPIECDWGMMPAAYDAASGQLNTRRITGFSITTLTIQPAGSNALNLKRATVFTDASGRQPIANDETLTRAVN